MAEQDTTTTGKEQKGFDWFHASQEVIPILRAIRASGNLLTLVEDPSELEENTLVDLGGHLEDLATQGLVILRYENPKEKPEPQVAPETKGGAA